MQSVRNYLLSHRQSQKMYFHRAHITCNLIKLRPGQEVLFRSLVKDEYIPPDYCETSYHAMQLHHGGPRHKVLQHKGRCVAYPPQHPQYCTTPTTIPKPKPSIICIPKPNPKHKHPPCHTPLPGPSTQPPVTFPILQSHALPKPLRLIQPNPSKTFFETYLPQIPSQC